MKLANTYSSIAYLLEHAQKVNFSKGEVLTQQYAKANNFFLLEEGEISFHLQVSSNEEALYVGKSHAHFTPAGWSGFKSPYRYATTVKVASKSAVAYQWEHASLQKLIAQEPIRGMAFLQMIAHKSRELIADTIEILYQQTLTIPLQDMHGSISEEYQTTGVPSVENVFHFLQRSPFFEVFEESHLLKLANNVERRQYRAQDIIYEQSTLSDGAFMLVSGKIDFSYLTDNHEASTSFTFNTISTPGFIAGWPGMINADNIITATASEDTIISFIPNKAIHDLINKNVIFGIGFYNRILWLISNQLQTIRTRLIFIKFNKEIIAINNLIEQNSTLLNLNSELHKIPHLLNNIRTTGDAYTLLEHIKKHGDSNEKRLAIHSIGVLHEAQLESNLYKGLINVYNAVKLSNNGESSNIRKVCAHVFQEAFKPLRQQKVGEENLPTGAGHIFIYNHLRNHAFNTLPNHFQVTLDSHYISSCLLYQKYGDPGIRVVRVGSGPEYAHQDYYEKLGHIDVYTHESGADTQKKETKEARRNAMFQKAGEYLKAGINVLISPEGTSYSTEESPGPFKYGAFRLALSQEKEPLIVPVVIANFDKRARYNKFVCMVKPPFYVSEYVKDLLNKEEMGVFLIKLQKEYQHYVKEAIELTRLKSSK